MEFIAKDGTKFTNYDDARKYEEELDNSVTLEKCVADLRSGIANNKVFIANIKENDGKISSIILIHDDNGIDNNLKEAIILNTYGEPVSFFPNTFSADVVYTIEIYLKPEEHKAYFVVNGESNGDYFVEL